MEEPEPKIAAARMPFVERIKIHFRGPDTEKAPRSYRDARFSKLSDGILGEGGSPSRRPPCPLQRRDTTTGNFRRSIERTPALATDKGQARGFVGFRRRLTVCKHTLAGGLTER